MNDKPVLMSSDEYFNKCEKVKRMTDFGIQVVPVDVNEALVDDAPQGSQQKPLTKLKEDVALSQYTLRRRFSLGE